MFLGGCTSCSFLLQKWRKYYINKMKKIIRIETPIARKSCEAWYIFPLCIMMLASIGVAIVDDLNIKGRLFSISLLSKQVWNGALTKRSIAYKWSARWVIISWLKLQTNFLSCNWFSLFFSHFPFFFSFWDYVVDVISTELSGSWSLVLWWTVAITTQWVRGPFSLGLLQIL